MVGFEEYLDMAIQENKNIKTFENLDIGIYPELKAVDYYATLGFDMNQMLLDVLKKYNLDTIDGCKDVLPVVI